MAVSTGYDYGIRENLVKNGVNNNDIGYNKGTGYVQVKGQDVIKAPKVYQGTSFTKQQDFNTDWDKYQKSLQQPEVTAQAVTSPQVTQPSTGDGTSKNPYDARYDALLNSLMQQVNNPTPVDINAIYSSPQYAAQQAQAQRGAQQGIRAAQEAFGAAGFGRSTALGERAQDVQNSANEYLQTQVLPMLMQQEQASRQQQMQNQFGVLDQFMNQQGVYDTRQNNENDLRLKEADRTGVYRPSNVDQIIGDLLKLKDSTKTATADERSGISANADNLRSQLSALGIENVDQLFGSGVSLDNAKANAGNVGVKTIQAKQFDQQKQQQEWSNAFAEGQFDYQKASDVWDRQFKDKSFDQSVKEAAASRGLQWANLNQNQQEFVANQAYREKQFEYQQEQDAKGLDQTKFNQGMEAYKTTGKMPSYMSGYGVDVAGMNDPGINEDLNAMYGMITAGAKPDQLIKQIDDKVKLGIEDQSSGDKLKSALYKLYPELDPSAPKKEESSKWYNSKFVPSWNPFNYSGLTK